MPVTSAKNRTKKTKTILLVIGIVIAILLTFYADTFSQNKRSFFNHLEKPTENPVVKNTSSNKIIGNNSYHSAAKLFEIFTHNLPYLNDK
ncbi:MAG: hypothetical protein RLO09_23580 [Cyclobacteriaceae bacterium]